MDLSDVFLMIRWKLWIWERKTTEVKCYCHSIISRVHTSNVTYCCWKYPWSPGRSSRYLFFALRYNSILLYLLLEFFCFGHWLSVGFCVPLTYPHQCRVVFPATSLLSGTVRCSKFILHISCSSPEQPFLQGVLTSFIGEWYKKRRSWH